MRDPERHVRVDGVVHEVGVIHGWGGETRCCAKYRHDETYVSPIVKRRGYDFPIGDRVDPEENVTCLACIAS